MDKKLSNIVIVLFYGFEIDYKKFRGWLRQKYNPEIVSFQIGYKKKSPQCRHTCTRVFSIVMEKVYTSSF